MNPTSISATLVARNAWMVHTTRPRSSSSITYRWNRTDVHEVAEFVANYSTSLDESVNSIISFLLPSSFVLLSLENHLLHTIFCGKYKQVTGVYNIPY